MFLLVEIDDVLPEVLGHIERALDGASLTPADIVQECRDNRALCFYAAGQGFAICKLHPNRAHNDLELCAWIVVSFGPRPILEFVPELDELARSLNAKRVVFSTFRAGFMRRPPPGWRLREMVLEREVPHGCG